MIKRLIRLAYPYGKTRTVLRGPVRDMKFNVIHGMGASYALGMDYWSFPFLAPKIRQGMTIYDVGANCGQMTLFFARMTGTTGKVFSFEPAPANATLLRSNVETNNLGNVAIMEMALGATNGLRSFVFEASRHTMGTFDAFAVARPGANSTLSVQCKTIDQLVCEGSPKPDLIKIDVEGAGGEVLDGAAETISRWQPTIFFEVHASTPSSPELLALERLRSEWNYSILSVPSLHDVELVPMWGSPVWCKPSEQQLQSR